MPAPRHSIPPEILNQLDEIQVASGIALSTFGRRFFNDSGFLDRVRRVGSCKRVTHERVSRVLELAAAGKLALSPLRRRAMSTDLLPRVLAAVAVSGLGIQEFSRQHLGNGYVASRMRKPFLLSASLTERVKTACDSVLGLPAD